VFDPRHSVSAAACGLALLVLCFDARAEAPAAPAEVSAAERVALTSFLLLNPDFSQWNNELPAAWIVSDPGSVSKAAEAETGATLVSVLPAGKDFVDLRQNPDPALCLPGDQLILEADCYADEAGSVEAVLRINFEGDKRVIMRESHPGGGWAKLRVICQVPEAPLSLVECRIRVLKAAETPVRVRSAQAQIVPAIP
jgi:hypothetical protein